MLRRRNRFYVNTYFQLFTFFIKKMCKVEDQRRGDNEHVTEQLYFEGHAVDNDENGGETMQSKISEEVLQV
jgi:hypothetical protein